MQTNNTCKANELIERGRTKCERVDFFSMSFTKWWQTPLTYMHTIQPDKYRYEYMRCTVHMAEGAKPPPPQPPQYNRVVIMPITRCLSLCVFIESVFSFFTFFLALFRLVSFHLWSVSPITKCHVQFEYNACFLWKNAHVCKVKCVDLLIIIVLWVLSGISIEVMVSLPPLSLARCLIDTYECVCLGLPCRKKWQSER